MTAKMIARPCRHVRKEETDVAGIGKGPNIQTEFYCALMIDDDETMLDMNAQFEPILGTVMPGPACPFAEKRQWQICPAYKPIK